MGTSSSQIKLQNQRDAICGDSLSSQNHDLITLNKGFVKPTCPRGTDCVGKYCEWNHDAAKDVIILNKECPLGTGCVGEFCEWNHNASK